MSNFSEINKLVENDLIISNNNYFTAIIGESPSKGARSPLLWNHAFNKNGIDCKMLPLDVKPNNLSELINKLNQNNFFLGGAVTIPYKEKIADILKFNMTNNAIKIGAVNCLFRKENNKIFGTNTDGEASLSAFNQTFGKIDSEKILILGPGGAGKAVASYFSSSLNDPKYLYIAGRSNEAKMFCSSINSKWLDWNEINNNIHKFKIIINCTNLGFNKQRNISPLSDRSILKIDNEAIVYDIIYDPSPSLLLKKSMDRNLKILDGKKMNLLQATIAFDYCILKERRKLDTYDTMFEIYKKLN